MFLSSLVYTGPSIYQILRISDLIMVIIFIFLVSQILTMRRGLYFNQTFLLIFLLISFFSLYNVFIGRCSIDLFFKQFTGILIHSFCYYTIVRSNRDNLENLFKIYFKIAFVVALIGLIQGVAFLFYWERLYNFSWLPYWKLCRTYEGLLRVNSIFPEPSGLAVILSPAFFIATFEITKKITPLKKRLADLVIIAVMAWTFSLIALLSFLLTLILFLKRRSFGFLKIFIIILLCFSLAYCLLPEVRIRVEGLLPAIAANCPLNPGMLTFSTFAFVINFKTAFSVFLKENFLFGNGLGSHQLSFDRYYACFLDKENWFGGGLALPNRCDANSLFLRLLSETGIFGLACLLIFIFRFFSRPAANKVNYAQIINNGILILFILRLMRTGHYWDEGFFFFFWLYFFTSKRAALDSD
jgi:hypothetical protein